MQDINSVALSGNLTRDAELKYSASGTAIASFSLAVNCDYGERKETAFVDCVAWGKLAEIVGEKCKKGHRVFVSGSIRQDTWQDKTTGAKRTKLKLSVNQMLDQSAFKQGTGLPEQSTRSAQTRPATHDAAPPQGDADAPEDQEDIPF